VRDSSLLESALARPKQILAYGEPDVFELAAAYASGIVRNHPFVDGNKRTGFISAFVFLACNGHKLIATEVAAAQAVVDLAAGHLEEAGFAEWLRGNCEPR
jgi:death-on-curing protein